MSQFDIKKLLSSIKQEHLSQGLDLLSYLEQKDFETELLHYGPSLLESQKAFLNQPLKKKDDFKEWDDYEIYSEKDREAGETLVQNGKTGCLILAGGQGSRLGASVPKGTIAVSPVKGKSLFQIFFERTLAASHKHRRNLPIAIMTSPSNHLETIQFLSSHDWFGLKKEQVDIFSQEELPFCDDLGNWVLERPGKLAKGPDGNGNALKLFYKAGIFDKWNKAGVELLNVIQVDNALADPFDEIFFGFHARKNAECSIKSVMRENESEKVGVLASHKNKLNVVEYTEIPSSFLKTKETEQSLRFPLASIGLFCFSFDFIKRHALSKKAMPWHASYKTVAIWNGSAKKQSVWKFEHFLFDAFDESNHIHVLLTPRELCYAALKNASGEKSLETVQKALIHSAKIQYEYITGRKAPKTLLELDPAFYYLSNKQRSKWKDAIWPKSSYIEPASL